MLAAELVVVFWFGGLSVGELDWAVELEAQIVAEPRHLPERAVGFRRRLAQFEIRGADLVRERTPHKRHEQNQDEERVFHFAFATFFGPFAGSKPSMVTL